MSEPTMCLRCEEKTIFKHNYWFHLPGSKCNFKGDVELRSEAIEKLKENLRNISFKRTCNYCKEIVNIMIPEFDEIKTERHFDLYNKGKMVFNIFIDENRIINDVEWIEVKSRDILSDIYVDHRIINRCDSTCMSMRTLGIKLGYIYYRKNYPCEARKIMDQITRGFNFMDGFEYLSISCEKNINGDTWISFLKKFQCLRCSNDYNASFRKPYCSDCYKKTKEENTYKRRTEGYVNTKSSEKITWLNDLPRWKRDKDCNFCKQDYINNKDSLKQFWDQDNDYVTGYTWYFGEKKACCTRCLQIEMEKRNIII